MEIPLEPLTFGFLYRETCVRAESTARVVVVVVVVVVVALFIGSLRILQS
jgi:hypothetical protein